MTARLRYSILGLLAAGVLAELLSHRRSCDRIAEALVRWARAA
jgi:hypothetical protein